jgi:hypothetical protein
MAKTSKKSDTVSPTVLSQVGALRILRALAGETSLLDTEIQLMHQVRDAVPKAIAWSDPVPDTALKDAIQLRQKHLRDQIVHKEMPNRDKIERSIELSVEKCDSVGAGKSIRRSSS